MTTERGFAELIALGRAAAMLTVTRIVGRISTFIAVEPYRLSAFPEVSVERITEASAIASALDAIEAGAPHVTDWNIDTRTELLFADADGAELLSVYLGTFAWSGQIAGHLCMFDEPTLRGWLLDRYGDA